MNLFRLLKHDIASECQEWVQENLITAEQATKICQRYNIDYKSRVKSSSEFGYNTLLYLGYILLGAAVFLIFGYNWEYISRELKILIFITLTTSTNILGLIKKSTTLFFLGNLFFGATLFLIAQQFHLSNYWREGFLLWSISAFLTAFLNKSNINLLLGLVTSFIFFYLYLDINYFNYYYIIFLVLGFFYCVKINISQVNFLALIITSSLFGAYYFTDASNYFDFTSIHWVYFSTLAMAWYLISDMIEEYKDITKVWILRLSIVLLMFLSFKDIWHSSITNIYLYNSKNIIFFIFIIITASWFLFHHLKKDLINSPQIITLLFFLIGSFIMLFGRSSWFFLTVDNSSLIMAILVNLYLLLMGIYFINLGVKLSRLSLVFFGTTIILLITLFRYVNLIGGYLGGAAIFCVAAMIILFCAKTIKRKNNALL